MMMVMRLTRPFFTFLCFVCLLQLSSCSNPLVAGKEDDRTGSQEIGNTLVTDSMNGTLQPSLPPEGNMDDMTSQEGTVLSYPLSSTDFEHKAAIPVKFSCKGEDISPQLQWKDTPQGTMSFALIVDDPDAPSGTWIHWVYYNIPAGINQLPQGIKRDKELSDGSRNGTNSWGKVGYNGPCPPAGQHRYFFKLYALDAVLDLKAGATKPELLKAMQGHILGLAELMGTFAR
jgi:Raf kinase inhibitor-like YbhB/YbcL family protein